MENPYDQFDQAPPTANPYDQFDPQAAYTSGVLPFSYDSSGHRTFDPVNAGLTARLWSAISAPADAVEGKIMPSYGNPEATSRAMDFASFFSPMSAATRAGEIAPGAATSETAPSATQLKTAAANGYNALENSGLEIDPAAVSEMATGLQSHLTRRGFGASVAPATHDILDQVANPAPLKPGDLGRVATFSDLQALRSNLGNISGVAPKDQLAGSIAKRAVDDFLGSVNPSSVVAGTVAPEDLGAVFRDANGNYSAAMRSNDLTGELNRANTGILERADARAAATNSGHNLDNAIRQRVASLLEKPDAVSGYSNAELDALRAVVNGGPVRNAARQVGNVLGGGGGIGHLATAGIGAGAGHLVGGDPSQALMAGAALPVAGYLAKALQNTLGERSLQTADQITRMNSPLAQALAAQGALMQPAIGRNSAVLRSVMPGLLSPPQGLTPQQSQSPARGSPGSWIWS